MSIVKDSTRVYKMGNTNRADVVSKEARELPGPGNYANQDLIGKDSRSFVIAGKPKDMQDNRVPGPGAYDPTIHLVKD